MLVVTVSFGPGTPTPAVENEPKIAAVYQRLYPNDTVIVGDAHQYLLEHAHKFDFIWSSPPCQSHSRMNKATRHTHLRRYPDMSLYQEIIFLTHFFKGKFIVENVHPYYDALIKPTVVLGRHLAWTNFDLEPHTVEQPKGFIQKSTLAAKKEMMDWLDIHFEEVIYYGKNHCPVQILRNCVHPLTGKHVLDSIK